MYIYKKRDIEDGDIPVPEMWNANMEGYSAEMNGLLTSENLPRNAVGVSQTIYNSTDGSTSTHSYVKFITYSTSFTVELDNKGWQEIPAGIPAIVSSVEEMVEFEASITVNPGWGGGSTPPTNENNAFVQFQILVDGMFVCETGLVSTSYAKFNVQMNGCTPIVAGSSVVSLVVRYGKEAAGEPDPSSITVTHVAFVTTRWKR